MLQDLLAKIILADEFTPVFDKLEKELTKTEDGFKKATKGAENFSHSAGGFGAIAGGVAGITSKVIDLGIQGVQAFGGFVAGSVALNSQLETVTTTFTQLLGSTAAAVDLVTRLKTEAGAIGQPFNEMAAAAQALVVQAGGANEEFDRLLKIAEILAAVKPEQGLEGAAVAIAEFTSSGGKDLVSLSERFNISKATIRKFTQDGKTDLASLATALEKSLGDIGFDEGLIEAQKNTLNGLQNQILAFASEAQTAFGEPIFEVFTEGLQDASKFIQENKAGLLEFATTAGESLAVLFDAGKVAIEIVGGIAEKADLLLEKIFGLGDTTPLEKLNAMLAAANQIFILATSAAAGLAVGFSESMDEAVSFVSERVLAFFAAWQAGIAAAQNLENPFAAMEASLKDSKANFKTSLSDVWTEFSTKGKEAAQQTFIDLANLDRPVKEGVDKAKTALDELQSAGQASAAAIAQAYSDLAADREKLQAGLNQKIQAAEFDHAQRIIRINQDIARAVAEAAADAATARLASGAKLAEGLAEIDRDLFTESVAAADKYNADIAKLDQDRRDAKRKTAADIRANQKKLDDDLRVLQRETGEEINSINSDLADDEADIDQELADDIADRAAKAETERLGIVADFGQRRLALEKQIADRRKSINDTFESEFAEADPFKRKILEFNRKEALAQLNQQQADESAALNTQEALALKTLTDRVAAEAAILEREAAEKKARLEREAQQRRDAALLEAAERAEALRQEAAERKTALEARLKDELEANSRRKAELQASLQAEQAARDAAAAEARAKLVAKNAEEMAAITAQEAEKVARAEDALRKENENHADRLTQLRFANQQEVGELQDKLLTVEREEQESYLRRLQEARVFAGQRSAILNGSSGPANPSTVGGLPGFAGGGAVPAGPSGGGQTTSNHITVNNYGAPAGFAGGVQTGRTVKDILRGF